MNKMWLGGALVIVLGAGVIGFTRFEHVSTASASTGPQSAAVQQTSQQSSATAVGLSDLSFTDVSGKVISVNPNDKTVLHFMTSSCSDCLPTETTLAKFQNTQGVKLVSIDVEPQADNASTIAQFSKVAGSHWPYVLETNSSLLQKFHVTELDTVVVLYHNKVIYEGVVPSAAQLKKVLA
ncbi:TlpA family protein disulfide reductase [Alicyclobacillus ferrooxydans]|uniref:Thioredoxin domain-containing protein n=1 Tax=Alicyclobacillus ferrooxydans TaxID=471514 RepID=A0A0P9GS25_9BACL|nr:hypothetical protein [Alicyclobacillus ferrooxydans]KPV43843.1 hypothetical protein AN477_10760 [Alicyclobacillus ferrooxydans]